MPNRQFYTLKFKSSRLKEFEYNVDITFDKAKEFKEVIALADSQMLRSIRDITKRTVKYSKLEKLYFERKLCNKRLLKKCETFDKNKFNTKIKLVKQKDILAYKNLFDKLNGNLNFYSDRIAEIQNKINRTMFIPNYIVRLILF